MNPCSLLAPHALMPGGWARDVLLEWDDEGTLTSVTPDAVGSPCAAGPVVPGMPNLHSHAFQRAFAGLTEYRGEGEDSFWSWRDRMYRFANAVTPEQLEDIATHLYVEMLQAGYTSVCEFHYLHHDPRGRPYADPAEMGRRIAAAAGRAGIGLTLLPVLYQSSGFGGRPPLAAQRRFVNDVDALLGIAERLRTTGARVGVAPHSLRAVAPEALRELLAGAHAGSPVHIHIAEQQREVDDCLAWSKRRPLHWLLENAAVDARWCLVHATHADAGELRAVAAAGATVGVCPSTEANLGDGRFDAPTYLAAGGAWGIGSDSHAGVDAAEELRWLEYTQRLATRQRNVLATVEAPQLADRLWSEAAQGGALAAGRPVGTLSPGRRADFLVLAGDAALTHAQQLACHVFARHPAGAIHEVWVGGRCRVAQGRHAIDEPAQHAFAAARAQLLREV